MVSAHRQHLGQEFLAKVHCYQSHTCKPSPENIRRDSLFVSLDHSHFVLSLSLSFPLGYFLYLEKSFDHEVLKTSLIKWVIRLLIRIIGSKLKLTNLIKQQFICRHHFWWWFWESWKLQREKLSTVEEFHSVLNFLGLCRVLSKKISSLVFPMMSTDIRALSALAN